MEFRKGIHSLQPASGRRVTVYFPLSFSYSVIRYISKISIPSIGRPWPFQRMPSRYQRKLLRIARVRVTIFPFPNMIIVGIDGDRFHRNLNKNLSPAVCLPKMLVVRTNIIGNHITGFKGHIEKNGTRGRVAVANTPVGAPCGSLAGMIIRIVWSPKNSTILAAK